jgi:hypothetical protein
MRSLRTIVRRSADFFHFGSGRVVTYLKDVDVTAYPNSTTVGVAWVDGLEFKIKVIAAKRIDLTLSVKVSEYFVHLHAEQRFRFSRSLVASGLRSGACISGVKECHQPALVFDDAPYMSLDIEEILCRLGPQRLRLSV